VRLRMRAAPAARTDEPDREAFEQMLEPCFERLWRYAYRLARHAEDAEDLLAEGLAEGYRSFGAYRGDSSFATWMYRVLTTTWLDMRRKAARRRTDSLDEIIEREGGIRADPASLSHADPEAALLRDTFSEDVERAMSGLPPEYRAVVVLADVEEMDYRDVARLLGVPVGTVRSRLHRARRILRAALTPGHKA